MVLICTQLREMSSYNAPEGFAWKIPTDISAVWLECCVLSWRFNAMDIAQIPQEQAASCLVFRNRTEQEASVDQPRQTNQKNQARCPWEYLCWWSYRSCVLSMFQYPVMEAEHVQRASNRNFESRARRVFGDENLIIMESYRIEICWEWLQAFHKIG